MLLSVLVSSSELKLLSLIREIGYGEMFGVEILPDTYDLKVEVTEAEKSLLDTVRGGFQYIDVLTIHNGAPIVAEVDFQDSGFRCRKKLRFPTVKAEG